MTTLAHKLVPLQDTMEGEHKVNNESLSKYVIRLVHDNADYCDGSFQLKVSSLSHEDKVIFLSRIVSAEDYQFYMGSQMLTRIAIRENEWQMQNLVDSCLPQAWDEVQDEIDKWKSHNEQPSQRIWGINGSCDSDDWFSQTYGGY